MLYKYNPHCIYLLTVDLSKLRRAHQHKIDYIITIITKNNRLVRCTRSVECACQTETETVTTVSSSNNHLLKLNSIFFPVADKYIHNQDKNGHEIVESDETN